MKFITFGEIMMRLQPEGYKRISQAERFDLCFGGSEANVAVSLANYGQEAVFLTKIPDNAIGDRCIRDLKANGVDTSAIVLGGPRMGIYFTEKGASQRASTCLYDRAGSSITTLKKKEINVKKLFAGATWFHTSGITPALGKDVADVTVALMKAAKEKGLTTSCDLNYRKKLWSKEEANKVMTACMPYTDVLIANEEDVSDVFGLHADGTNIVGGKLSEQGYIDLGKKVLDRFPSLKYVAFTLRESFSASRNGWSGLLVSRNGATKSKRYELDVIDRVGGGDSFSAGLIYALASGMDDNAAINFGIAASALKHSIEGDYNRVSVAEVTKLAEGDGSGRIQR